jgi:hypothetical protein
MPIAEECLNRRPEATFHNRVNLWQSLALKLWRDPSPVCFSDCDNRRAISASLG